MHRSCQLAPSSTRTPRFLPCPLPDYAGTGAHTFGVGNTLASTPYRGFTPLRLLPEQFTCHQGVRVRVAQYFISVRIESKRGISPLSARRSMASLVTSTTLHRCSLGWQPELRQRPLSVRITVGGWRPQTSYTRLGVTSPWRCPIVI